MTDTEVVSSDDDATSGGNSSKKIPKDNKTTIKDPNLQKCPLCYEKKLKIDFSALTCKHSFCRPCLDGYYFFQQKNLEAQLALNPDKGGLNTTPVILTSIPCPTCRLDSPWTPTCPPPQKDSRSPKKPGDNNNNNPVNQAVQWQIMQQHERSLQKPNNFKQFVDMVRSMIWIKMNTSPCPRCRAPTMRDGNAGRNVVCSVCRHNWCWSCGRVYHRNTPCVTAKERQKNIYFAIFLFAALQLLTGFYHMPTLLNVIGIGDSVYRTINYPLNGISYTWYSLKQYLSNSLVGHDTIFYVAQWAFFILGKIPWTVGSFLCSTTMVVLSAMCRMNTVAMKYLFNFIGYVMWYLWWGSSTLFSGVFSVGKWLVSAVVSVVSWAFI